jgi:hypothetical protein
MLHKLYTWIDYGLYLIKSNSLHGTHSPFVYRWAEEVLYSKQSFPNHHVELARSWALKSSKTPIDSQFSLKQWAMRREPSAKYGQLLQRHLMRFRPARLLQYGAGLGVFPAYSLELPNEFQPQVHVQLENPSWLPYLEKTMELVGQATDSWVIHEKWNDGFEWQETDLVLIDAAWLIKQDQSLWFERWDHLVHAPHSVWVYNVQANEQTRHWSRWMQHHGPYNISVDLFWTLCLFSRPEQSAETFTLRY